MSYASQKGYSGEVRVSNLLNDIFRSFGYKFFRVGGVEKNKKTLMGDVCLNNTTDTKNNCVLREYFLESKKKSNANVSFDFQKAEDDAWQNGKMGSILFYDVQKKGEVGKGGIKFIVISEDTFKRIMIELQGYRNF